MVLAKSFNETNERDSVAAFAARIQGEVIVPGSADYSEARLIWNRVYSRFPDVVVRAVDAIDVVSAVRFARQSDLPIAIRSGSHSLAGFGSANGSVVIDLSGMRNISLDLERREVWVQAGAKAGDLVDAAQEHEMVVPTGDVSTVGIGGLTLGGGIGWLARKYGLTIDSLLAVELVTAEGELITASQEEHEDLFWAVRGGGGNFGVITAFKFRLHPLGTIVGGAIIYPATPELIKQYTDIAAAAPDELTTIAYILHAPPAPFIPADKVGMLSIIITACYAGDLDKGERVVQPLRELGEPIVDMMGPMPYAGLYEITAEARNPTRAATRMMYTDEIEESTLATFLQHMEKAPSPTSMTQIRVLGGQAGRVDANATAYAHRDRTYFLAFIGEWREEGSDDANKDWLTTFWNAVRDFGDGAYVNFVEDEGEGRVRAAYPRETYRRLAEVKQRYDPENVFHINQNVRPRQA